MRMPVGSGGEVGLHAQAQDYAPQKVPASQPPHRETNAFAWRSRPLQCPKLLSGASRRTSCLRDRGEGLPRDAQDRSCAAQPHRVPFMRHGRLHGMRLAHAVATVQCLPGTCGTWRPVSNRRRTELHSPRGSHPPQSQKACMSKIPTSSKPQLSNSTSWFADAPASA